MNAIATFNFVSSQPLRPAAALRRFHRAVRQYLPTISRGNDYSLLVQGYEQMAGVREAAGDESGAGYYAAHAAAIRNAVEKN